MYAVWMEWDYGQENTVFSSLELALNWIARTHSQCEYLSSEYDTVDDVMDAGLAGIMPLRVDP